MRRAGPRRARKLRAERKGDLYEELVGEVQRALDPGAIVDVGVWVKGPDGRRDCDVRVIGTVNGHSHFILIECKDWSDTVGIGVVDALDSKRRDLGADRAVIFAHRFTADAKRKARRAGIDIATALKHGDGRVRTRIVLPFFAQVRAIQRYTIVYEPSDPEATIPEFQPNEIQFDGLPLLPWLAKGANQVLRDAAEVADFCYRVAFNPPMVVSIRGTTYEFKWLGIKCECHSYYVQQEVPQDVTLGYFDRLRSKAVVPNGQSWILGPIDNTAWERVGARLIEIEPDQDGLQLCIVLIGGIIAEGAYATKLDEMSSAAPSALASQVTSPIVVR